MRAELAGLREQALTDIAACQAEAELEAVRVRYLGKKGSLNAILRGLGGLSAEERPAVGALANDIKDEILARIAEKASELASDRLRRSLAVERIDVTLPGRARPRGHTHPLRAVPPDHPARDTQDTLFLTLADDALLRTHTSPVQIRVMRSQRPPLRVIVPGACYRRDEPDATHSPMFHQVEGFMVDEQVTFADLKGVLVHFLRRLFGPETGVRFRPSFFPFTEPSAEVDIACSACAVTGRPTPGCRVCRGKGWLEVLGSGMIHPNVLRAVGYDPEVVRGFAFGMGIDRLALLRHDLDDLRLFFENDLRFLGQYPS